MYFAFARIMDKILENPLFFSVVVAAVVSALVTFVLNIFLERYKFKNQYRQLYANRKLLGCEELNSAISKIYTDFFVIRGIIVNKQNPKELSDSLVDLGTEYTKDMKDQVGIILKNVGYVSPELRDEMLEYISAINASSLSSQTLYQGQANSEKYINSLFEKISEKLADEMKKNPYGKQ